MLIRCHYNPRVFNPSSPLLSRGNNISMIDRRSRLRGVLIARRSVPLIIGVHRAGWLITIGCPRVVTKVRSMFDRGILFNSSRSSDYFSFQRPHGRPLRYFAFFYGVLSFSHAHLRYIGILMFRGCFFRFGPIKRPSLKMRTLKFKNACISLT